jgi:hypothetical protein
MYGSDGLSDALQSQKDCLEFLDLKDMKELGDYNWIDPFPSLQGFINLKHIRLTDAVLWGDNESYNDPDNETFQFFTRSPQETASYLIFVLPQSLETFTHLICPDLYAYYRRKKIIDSSASGLWCRV